MVRTFDMFCGAGGSSAGAARAGAVVVGGVDLCPLAARTYEDNFPAAAVFNRPADGPLPQAVLDEIGDIDLVLASPECTNHSCARGARPRVEASRETALHILQFATMVLPRWIIIENVTHMRPWSRYAELIERLKVLGYDVAEHVLDAADFGVPQRRRRLFVLCDRENSAPAIIPKRPGQKRAARSILDRPGTWQVRPLRNSRRAEPTLARAQRAINALGQQTAFLLVYYGTDGAGGWQSLDVPLRTITTIDRFGLVEPSADGHTLRMLQVPELARAMGFDRHHALSYGSRRDRIRLLGNAVCPPVMEAVVKALCGDEVNGVASDTRRRPTKALTIPMRHLAVQDLGA